MGTAKHIAGSGSDKVDRFPEATPRPSSAGGGLRARLRLFLPRSLRRKFTLVVWGLVVLMAAETLVAVYALRDASRRTRALVTERLARQRDAQDLVQRTTLIEREALLLRAAASVAEMRRAYVRMGDHLDEMDHLLGQFAAGSADPGVLNVQEAGQLFRNTSNVVVRLEEQALNAEVAFSSALRQRTEILLASADRDAVALAIVLSRLRSADRPEDVSRLRQEFMHRAIRSRHLPPAVLKDMRVLRARSPAQQPGTPSDPFSLRAALLDRRAALERFAGALKQETIALVSSARALSDRSTAEYREAVMQLAERASASELRVMALLAGSLALSWTVYELLRRRVLVRLQVVSHHLRAGGAGQRTGVPVEGSDEIAEMARAVEQFLADRQRLAEANRDLEAFSYSVSHDLRAPVRHVNGFLELLQKHLGTGVDARARHYMDTISQESQRMGDLVEGLLLFSRASRTEMLRARVDLGALLPEVIEQCAPDAAGRQVRWVIGALPTVCGDRTMLRAVLSNLLANALKFTRTRAVAEIEVAATAEASGDAVVFVRDNGVGFDSRYAQKLFGMFQRLHQADEFEGYGIGLAHAQRIIARHGGRMWAESSAGHGATFFFSLPSALPANVIAQPT
jgi:signal transduction histidine kinase